MRIAVHDGRQTALTEGGGIDIARATGGRFSSDVIDALERWDELAYNWGPPPPPSFISPDDLAGLMVGVHGS
jgi:hypothetical protein